MITELKVVDNKLFGKIDNSEWREINYETEKNLKDLEIKVKYHKELCPNLEPIEIIEQGDWIDLRCAEEVSMKAGEVRMISLGVSMQIPKGYTAIVAPRSSTINKYGIIMGNSIGIIDESYCGDNDIWRFIAYAIRDTEIHVNERIAQFKIEPKMNSLGNIFITPVERLENADRGGIGSTGTI